MQIRSPKTPPRFSSNRPLYKRPTLEAAPPPRPIKAKEAELEKYRIPEKSGVLWMGEASRKLMSLQSSLLRLRTGKEGKVNLTQGQIDRLWDDVKSTHAWLMDYIDKHAKESVELEVEAIIRSGSLFQEEADQVISLRYDFQVPTWKQVRGKPMLTGSDLKRLVYRNVVSVDDWQDKDNPIFNRDINKVAQKFLANAKDKIVKELKIPMEFADMVKFKGVSYLKHPHDQRPTETDTHWL